MSDAAHLMIFSPRQLERLKRAVANIDPRVVELDIKQNGKRIEIDSPATNQRWRIGPRGGG